MRKLSRIIGTILIGIMFWSLSTAFVSADVWEFNSEGKQKNPFTPRGYLVETERGQHWLSSVYDNSGVVIRYTGVRNGIEYLDAKKSDGSDYTFYAMTDRKPWTDKSSWIGYGQKYLFAYKNGSRIANFNDYVKTPPTRGDKVDPSGENKSWVFEIEGFTLEPGCRYEFGFLRGMQANNGITLVLAEDEKGNTTGYIQQMSEGLTAEERSRYNSEKDKEYEFISSWYKKEGGGYTVNFVPMRFSVQTYADLSKWESAVAEAQDFLDSVTEKELKQGKYVRSNIEQLELLLKALNEKAENEVKMQLQTEANASIRSMKNELAAMLEKAMSEKPEPADMSKLKETIREAEALYAKANVNVGLSVGQYGQIEVDNLQDEIGEAHKVDRFYPQSEIDAQVQALEDAMEEVLASKVMEEQMIFYDKITDIYVVAPVGSLSEDAKLFVRIMGKETEDYKSIEKNLSEKDTEAVFYRIQFYEDDQKIQPNQQVEVQMPISDNISQKTSTVYSVGKKGSLTEVASVKSNGTQFFKTEKLTAFVMAGSTASDAEKAAARGERVRKMMAQKQDKKADDKQTKLAKAKKKKEEFKDPLNKILKRNANTATFSNDVRKKTDPQILILAAIVLAAVALAVGVRAVTEMRRNRKRR